MQEKERAFHLCQEPWICVIEPGYRTKKVTLAEALLHADQYLGLAGETAAQNTAVLRFLLAVLHTIFSRRNENGEWKQIDSVKEALRRWDAIWSRGEFPADPIQDYFEEWEDRFWLFDPRYPFYQVPGITGTPIMAKKMNGTLSESGNKTRLFSLQSKARKKGLQNDEAARWLIYLQAFDDTSAKNPSPSLCTAGSMGLVEAKGNSLFETLMLNLTLLKDGQELWGEAKPSWEREKPSAEKKKELPLPDNQPELLSMQCRRVLLHREGDMVASFTEAAGEYIEKESAFVEQMTFWREKKEKDVLRYTPKKHDSSRQMWRDFSAIIGETGRKPGVVSWIAKLQNRRILSKNCVVKFRIVGVEYGNMTCCIVDEFSDSLEFQAGILNDLGQKWQKIIAEEVMVCERLAYFTGKLGDALAKAAGGDGAAEEAYAKEQAYYRLDLPFRQWLLQVDPNQDLEWQRRHRMQWRQTSYTIIRTLGQELVKHAGDSAFAGRTVTDIRNRKEIEVHYSVPEAWNRFLYQIKKYHQEMEENA